MNDHNTEKSLLRALAGTCVTPPPVWLMRQAGRYLPEYRELRAGSASFLEFCLTPALAVEATLQPLRRFDFDAAILFSDILVVPHALGQNVSFEEGSGPVLDAIRDIDAIRDLNTRGSSERLAPVYETVAELGRQLPAAATLIGFAGSPWTVATYMVEGRGGTDHGRVKSWAYRAPDEFAVLIDVLVKASVDYLLGQARAGAEVIQLFDSWAGVLAETEFHRWVIEPTACIVRCLKEAHPDLPIIGFPRGAGVLFSDYAEGTGVDGIGLDSAVPVQWAATALQTRLAVQGNLDNMALVAGGDVLEREVTRILSVFGKGPFIFNLGHGILPETPPENVAQLVELVRAWKP